MIIVWDSFKKLIVYALSILFFATSAHSCLKLSDLEENDHYAVATRGWPVPDEGPSSQTELLENCRDYVGLQNSLVRAGAYEQSAFSYKLFWCTGETGVEPDHPHYVNGMEFYKYGYIVNVDLEDLILAYIDNLTIPDFPLELETAANLGDPACEPDCEVGDGINPYIGNLYLENQLLRSDGHNYAVSYNSLTQKWTSSLDAGLQSYQVQADDEPVEIKAVYTGDGRAHPIVSSQDAYFCSSDGTRGWYDNLSDEFTAELANKVLKFLPDGRLKSIVQRDIDRAINLDYDDQLSRVTVSSSGGQSGYVVHNDEQGRPTLAQSLGGGQPLSAELFWADNGNLVSITQNGETWTYLYENTAYPGAITGIEGPGGIRYTQYQYDSVGRIISTKKFDDDGDAIESISIDYSHIDETEPFTRITYQNGLVVDKYFEEQFGNYRTRKIIEKTPVGGSVVTVERTLNRLGHIIRSVDASGVITEFDRDGYGRVTEQRIFAGTADARTTRYVWDNQCGEQKIITEVGVRQLTREFDESCRIASETIAEL